MRFTKRVLEYLKIWLHYTVYFFKIHYKSTTAIRLENIELKTQLALYLHHYEKNQLPKPRPHHPFRQLWVLLSKFHKNWKSHLIVVKPATVVGWHRSFFKKYWRNKSKPAGRPPLSNEWISTIKKVHKENPLHSPEKIHDRLSLLGLEDVPAPNTIAKYLPDLRKPPTKKQLDSWRSFIHNHLTDTWAMDFLTIPTIKMEVLYVFVILHHKTRKIIQFGVTKNPNMAWVKQQLRNATPYGKGPKYLLHDNDPVFKSKEIQELLESSGIQSKSTSYRSPWQNAYVERVNGTLRREVLDYLIPLNERHLENKLAEYIYSYYNPDRTHQGINGKTPEPSPTYLPTKLEKSKLIETPVLGGLYHTYKRVS